MTNQTPETLVKRRQKAKERLETWLAILRDAERSDGDDAEALSVAIDAIVAQTRLTCACSADVARRAAVLALSASGPEGAAHSPRAEGSITALGKCHVLIGEVRRCIADDNLTAAYRKLDALDREVAALFDGSQSNG